MEDQICNIQGVETQFNSAGVAKVEDHSIFFQTPVESLTQSRVCIIQVAPADKEWDPIEQEHKQIFPFKNRVVHLNTPGNLFANKTKFEAKVFSWMSKRLNMEAWIVYCSWYDLLLEKAFESFVYSDVEEYRLEGFIKSFHNEVTSPFLKGIRSEIVKASGETELMNLRSELLEAVAAHLKVLNSIILSIQEIENTHPDFLLLKETGKILQILLKDQVSELSQNSLSWVSQQIYMQLLNDSLDVTSVIHGGENLKRARHAFAIRLGVMQMKQIFELEEIYKIAAKPNKNFQRLVKENLKFI